MIDLVYGFAAAGAFLLVCTSRPGSAVLTKGLSFGLLAWFFRVEMGAASQWITLNVPLDTLPYVLLASLGEMLAIGTLNDLTLGPAN